MTRSRTAKVSALVAVATLALTGCQVHPGAAAVVGGDTITVQRVDEVAQALCSANLNGQQATGQVRALPSRGAREGALRVLLDSALSEQFGAKEGVHPDQEQVSAALARNAEGISQLPADEQEAFRSALKQYAEGQLMLIDIGRRSLEAQGKPATSEDQAIAEGMRLRAQYAKSIDIAVDPRYGTYSNGNLQAASGSLSIPVSPRAFDGQSSDPSAAWVAALPAAQKCH